MITEIMNKTRNKNKRKRRRNGKNIFWLVLGTGRFSGVPMLFSREPHQYYKLASFADYVTNWIWFCNHSLYFPKENILERINVDTELPIKVKLELCDDEPDMYIQRYKDSLFISTYIETYYTYYIFVRKKHVQVTHVNRISNKLFPEVTEKSGIVGVRIVPFDINQ